MKPLTLLLRHAHPNFMDCDLITSQVFMPFPKDEGALSVYDGDQMNAAAAYSHYTNVLGNVSHSVWAVSKEESDRVGAPGSPDPRPDFAAHAKLDFGSAPPKTCRKIAKRLKSLAIARGCQYRPA